MTGSPSHRRIAYLLAAGHVLCLLAGCAAEPPAEADGEAAAAMPPDWRDATYSVTCDGIVPGGFPATLVDGAARVPGDPEQTPYYEYYDVRLEARVTGDVDADGGPDSVVLLQCSPQPSNGLLQEVQVFTARGDLLGVLPSPRTLKEGSVLAPLYDPGGLTVEEGDIVAAMAAYGPEDSRAGGPSIPLTVRWRWDGHRFVQAE